MEFRRQDRRVEEVRRWSGGGQEGQGREEKRSEGKRREEERREEKRREAPAGGDNSFRC